MDVYEHIASLRPGQSIFCDLHETLYDRGSNKINTPLIDALRAAKKRGIALCLWTGGTFEETVHGVELMKQYNLHFDDVFCNVLKADLFIDNKAVAP